MPALLAQLRDLDPLPPHARLIDVRWKLGDPHAGRRLFAAGHIPGAVYVDLDTDLAAPPGADGRHPLPSAEHFAAAMSRAGVDASTWVIAYDDGGAGAARLWWLLRHFGHTNASILDGGYPAWLAAGGVPETGRGQAPAPADFHVQARQDDVLDLDAVREALASGAIHLLDARAPERWRGDVEPVDRRPGRIPGALNAPAGDNVHDGVFLPPEELHARYAAKGILDGKTIVVACGSGVSACVDLVALELAGIGGAKLFPGSYSAWVAHDLPVETGPAEARRSGD